MVRLSLSGFPVGNAFSLLFVRFVEFSGKNRLKYVAMFHRRIFSITRAVVARYGDVSCDLNSFSIGFRLFYLIFSIEFRKQVEFAFSFQLCLIG